MMLIPTRNSRLEDALLECEFRIAQIRSGRCDSVWSAIQLCEAAAAVARLARTIERQEGPK